MIAPYIKKISFLLTIVVFSFQTKAQDGPWWVNYIIEKENNFMGITINMDYYYAKPSYRNLVLVGTSTKKCYKNGFPTGEGLEDFYSFSDTTAPVIDSLTKHQLVGIITYQCTGIDVYYVKDTMNLRNSLTKVIQEKFAGAQNYIFIQPDKKWEYYKNIYPLDVDDNFLMNQSFLNQLAYEGDDLSKPRKVTHWLYFKNDKNRLKFIDRIKVLEFSVDSLSFNKEEDLPYELQLSRIDNITPQNINSVTKILNTLSLSYNGMYDGWGTEAIKEEEPNQ